MPRAASDPSSRKTISLFSILTARTWPFSSPSSSTGEARKRKRTVIGLPVFGRRRVVLDDLDVAHGGSCRPRPAQPPRVHQAREPTTSTSPRSSSPISSSSGLVNAACSGPRRARIVISSIPLSLEHVHRVVGGVGPRQLARGQRSHRCHVDGDVPGADHHGMLGLKIDLQARVVRDGRCTRPRTPWLRAIRAGPHRGSEPFVDRGAERVDDRVVVLEEPPTAHVGPELDVTEEPKSLVLGGLVVGLRDRLDLRMVRSHAKSARARTASADGRTGRRRTPAHLPPNSCPAA